jgi:peptidoglycan/LPS O-acetylase OafA/YrhL
MKKLEILEFGRGFAAFYVLMHHLRPLRDTPFDILFRFGQEAVILFFLVSGFVIYLSCQASKPSLSK